MFLMTIFFHVLRIRMLDKIISHVPENIGRPLKDCTLKSFGEIKNTLVGINNRFDDTEEWVSKLEDRIVEITQAEQKKH